MRYVAIERVVGRGLVGNQVGQFFAGEDLRKNIRGVAKQANRDHLFIGNRLFDHAQRFFQRVGSFIEVTAIQSFLDPLGVHFDGEATNPGENRGQRLRAAHPTQAAGQQPASFGIAAIMLAHRFDEGLVSALHDALRADVYP